MFGFAYSLNLITGVIIGGLTSIWGGALGATVVIGLREVLRDLDCRCGNPSSWAR